MAPECEHFDEAGRLTRKAGIRRARDVWSLGCITIEALVYMHFGSEGVDTGLRFLFHQHHLRKLPQTTPQYLQK